MTRQRSFVAPLCRTHDVSLVRALVRLMLIGLVCLASPVLVTAARVDPVSPIIRVDVESSGQTHTIAVTGHGFTAGGFVFITVYDQGGMAVPGTLVVASHPTLQPPAYLEPGEGFSFDTGGNIRDEFQVPAATVSLPAGAQRSARGTVSGTDAPLARIECFPPLLVQAYDRASDTLSNVVNVHRDC